MSGRQTGSFPGTAQVGDLPSGAVADLLVVEDDETIGAALTSGLRAHGHAVSWQRTGRRALDAPWGFLDYLPLALLLLPPVIVLLGEVGLAGERDEFTHLTQLVDRGRDHVGPDRRPGTNRTGPQGRCTSGDLRRRSRPLLRVPGRGREGADR